MEPIIRYQGELYQGLQGIVQTLGTFANPLWTVTGLVWVLAMSGSALWLADRSALASRKEQFSHGWLWLLLVGVFVIRLPLLGLAEQNVDESQWIASAGTLIADPRFWISVDGTTSGPLNVYPLTLPWFLGLGIDYATIRLVGLLALVLTTGLLYKTFENVFGAARARVAILPIAIALAFMQPGDGAAYNSEHFPSLLLAAVLWLRSTAFNNGETWWRLILTGFLLGCVPYTKLQAVPLGLLLAGGIFLQLLTAASPHRWLNILVLAVGGLLPSMLVALYLWQTSNAEFFYKSFILANLGYAKNGSFGHGVQNGFGKLTFLMPRIFLRIYSTTVFFAVLPVILAGGAYLVLTSAKRTNAPNVAAYDRDKKPSVPFQTLLAFSILWVVVAIYSVLKPGNNFEHYQILSYVPAFWLAGLVLMAVLQRLDARWQKRLLSAWLIVLVLLPGIVFSFVKNEGIAQMKDPQPVEDGGLTATIARYARPNDKMVVWGWDNKLHVWTGLLMGSRFIPLYYPVFPTDLQPYFMQLHQQDMVRNQPAVIVDATSNNYQPYEPFRPENYPFVKNLLATQYRYLGKMKDYRLYVRKDRLSPRAVTLHQ